ncbi:MAG: ferredoxin:thioredoxin reductase [Candidatus Lokiarchaeota archaeon]|nr:ferredoxin:thioredoxin reductase [Candidatus Lokiarchaeota archaeon]
MDMETKEGMRLYVSQVAEKNNWILNEEKGTFEDLIDGLVDNKINLGYQSCPCRLASGKRDLDRDLICPCDYAALDIKDYLACYCNLYMSPDFYDKGINYIIVPERRPIEKENAALEYF